MVKQSIDEEVAKKGDLRELRADLEKTEILLSGDIKRLEMTLRNDLTQQKSELVRQITDVRTELKLEIGEIKGEIKNSRLKTIVWLGGIMFSLMSLMFAGLVYLEPIRKAFITTP